MNDRRKALEAFSAQLKEGLPFAEDFIQKADVETNALRARDLAEDSLAHQVLKNTGIPIPGQNAKLSQKEDFLNRIVQERYPELKPNVKLGDNYAQYGQGQIDIGKEMVQRDPIERVVGKTLHEAGHQYDDQILKSVGKELDLGTLRKARNSGLDLKGMDPAEVYEIYAKGHHNPIPNLREGSFGMGALKSFMKSGNFKQLAGPAIGLGAALAAGTPSDAMAEVVVPGGVSGAGESPEDEAVMLAEADARKNYNQSQARKDALKKLQK